MSDIKVLPSTGWQFTTIEYSDLESGICFTIDLESDGDENSWFISNLLVEKYLKQFGPQKTGKIISDIFTWGKNKAFEIYIAEAFTKDQILNSYLDKGWSVKHLNGESYICNI